MCCFVKPYVCHIGHIRLRCFCRSRGRLRHRLYWLYWLYRLRHRRRFRCGYRLCCLFHDLDSDGTGGLVKCHACLCRKRDLCRPWSFCRQVPVLVYGYHFGIGAFVSQCSAGFCPKVQILPGGQGHIRCRNNLVLSGDLYGHGFLCGLVLFFFRRNGDLHLTGSLPGDDPASAYRGDLLIGGLVGKLRPFRSFRIQLYLFSHLYFFTGYLQGHIFCCRLHGRGNCRQARCSRDCWSSS